MLNRNVLALAGAALILAATTVIGGLAHAQTASGAPSVTNGAVRSSASRTNAHPQAPTAAPAVPDAAANIAAAQAIAAGAGVTGCQITEATLLGDAPGGGKVYEAACATGPGYIFTGSTPPAAIDCVILADTLAKQAAAAPAAPAAPARPARGARNAPPAVLPVGCKMPANQDVMSVMRGYATAAGVPCQVDAAAPIGTVGGGSVVYEIGCAGADGYRIHETAGVWSKEACLLIVSSNGTCRFTTPAEQSATFKGWIGSSVASTCDVTQARYMGANANGSFYEAKCATGDGVIVRFDNAMAVQQAYPCATAALIGGGCKLTAVPAAVPAATAPPAQR